MQCADESTKPPSTRMKLHTKVVLARANPSFAPGLATRPSTRCTFRQRKLVVYWGLSDKNADTKEIERVAVDAAAQMDKGDTLIWDRLGRRALHPIHQYFRPAVREEFKNVACQSSSDLQRASILLQSNSLHPTKLSKKRETVVEVENSSARSRIHG